MCLDGDFCEFSRAAEQTADAIVITDYDGSIKYVNRALEELAGFPRDEVLGENLRALISEKYDERFDREFWQTLRAGKNFRAEYICKGKKGQEKLVDLTVNPVRNAQGRITHFVATGKDITECKQMLEELKNSEERYRHLLDEVPDCVFTITADAMIRSLNRAFETLTSWHRSEWVGRKFTDMLHPDDRSRALEMFRHILQGDRFEPGKYHILTKFGQYLVAEFSCTPLMRKGEIMGIVGVGRDTSQRAKAEQLLRESEERYRTLVEAAHDIIFVVNRDHALEYINDHGMRQLGRTIETLINQKSDTVFPPEFAEELHRGMEKVFETHHATQIEINSHFGSEEVYLATSLSPLLEEETDAVRAVLAIARDVTSRKQMGDEIRFLLREKEQLLHEIHHRVKNYLQVTSSLLNMEMQRLRTRTDAEIFREMQNRIKSMAFVFEEILKSDHFSQSNFDATVRRLIEQLLRSYGAGNIGVEFLLEGTRLPIYLAVPSAIILCELVSHALKHSFPRGRLGVITIGFQKLSDGTYKLTVADDGVGLRGVAETRNKAKALGLNLVGILVDQLGGSIVSENGHGTKHTIVFAEQ